MNIAVHQNHAEEKKRDDEFWSLQDEILETFGKHSPEPPKLNVCEVSSACTFVLLILNSPSFGMSHKRPSHSNGHRWNSPLPSCVLWISTRTGSASHRSRTPSRILLPSCLASNWILNIRFNSCYERPGVLSPRISSASRRILRRTRLVSMSVWDSPRYRTFGEHGGGSRGDRHGLEQ